MESPEPIETATLRFIQLHYRQRADELKWTTTRFKRLAAALQLTVYELAAFIRIPPSHIARHLAANKFPPTVELHLTLIENTVFPNRNPAIFPEIPCSSTTTS